MNTETQLSRRSASVHLIRGLGRDVRPCPLSRLPISHRHPSLGVAVPLAARTSRPDAPLRMSITTAKHPCFKLWHDLYRQTYDA
jgi:hypothetical protein